MKIFYIARRGSGDRARIIHGVVARSDWVALKTGLAIDGFAITYWNWVEDDLLDDLAA